mmetsp:Transcript_1339/g.4120  ORF Transcript_1339/g.4120 Transcript_1339/m.4120 type:complete len:270 (+) Transcript_1339:48-857(+)
MAAEAATIRGDGLRNTSQPRAKSHRETRPGAVRSSNERVYGQRTALAWALQHGRTPKKTTAMTTCSLGARGSRTMRAARHVGGLGRGARSGGAAAAAKGRGVRPPLAWASLRLARAGLATGCRQACPASASGRSSERAGERARPPCIRSARRAATAGGAAAGLELAEGAHLGHGHAVQAREELFRALGRASLERLEAEAEALGGVRRGERERGGGRRQVVLRAGPRELAHHALEHRGQQKVGARRADGLQPRLERGHQRAARAAARAAR